MQELLNQKVEAIQPQSQNSEFTRLSLLVYDHFRINSQLELSYQEFILQNQKLVKNLCILGQKVTENPQHYQNLSKEENSIILAATGLLQTGVNPLSFFFKEVVNAIFGETGTDLYKAYDLANLMVSPTTPEIISSLLEVTGEEKQTYRQRLEALYNSNS